MLGNPKPRKKKKTAKRRTFKKNPAPAREQMFSLRAITGDPNTGKNWRTLWWTGSKWTGAESGAKRFTKDAARKALAKVKKPAGWFVVDGIAM